MRKTDIIIFTAILLLTGGLFFIYIEFFVPHEGEHIVYAHTDAHQIIDFWPSVDLQIAQNGKLWLQGRSVKPATVKQICSHLFDDYGTDLPINLHVDKNALMEQVDPIINIIVAAGGREVRLVAKLSDQSFYYFSVLIVSKKTPDIILDISGSFIKINGVKCSFEYADKYLDNRSLCGVGGGVEVVCSGDLTYQKLIDILTSVRFSRSIALKIKEKLGKEI